MAADQQDHTSRLAGRAHRRLPRPSPSLTAVLLAAATVLGASSVTAQAPKPASAPPVAGSAAAIPAAAPAAASAAPAAPAPIRLDTVTAHRGDIQDSVDASGKLQLHKWADSYAQIGGQVKEVHVAIGDTVDNDQPLLDITPTLQPTKVESSRAQMARLQADLADQRAQLEYAELQFKRQTQLKAQNATREDAFESARMNASSANARVDAITAQIRELEAVLKIDEDARQKTQLRAPLAGTVVSLAVRKGQMVTAAQPAAPLLRIADLSDMTVAARVAENDVTRLRPGMAASFTTPGYPGKRWAGKLRQVIPIPADGTGEQGKQAFYIVLFEVRNPDKQLMSGMSAQVKFVVAQAHDAVLLPARGLGSPDEDGLYPVHVLDGVQHVSARKVKVGVRTAQQAQILSGLAEGEKVVIGPVPAALMVPLAPARPPVAALPGSVASSVAAAVPASVPASMAASVPASVPAAGW